MPFVSSKSFNISLLLINLSMMHPWIDFFAVVSFGIHSTSGICRFVGFFSNLGRLGASFPRRSFQPHSPSPFLLVSWQFGREMLGYSITDPWGSVLFFSFLFFLCCSDWVNSVDLSSLFPIFYILSSSSPLCYWAHPPSLFWLWSVSILEFPLDSFFLISSQLRSSNSSFV